MTQCRIILPLFYRKEEGQKRLVTFTYGDPEIKQWDRRFQRQQLRAILNFTPGPQGITSPLGVNLAPRGELCPLGVNFVPFVHPRPQG
jgi:hypothetical protein